jgi:hypothetical protein
MTDPKRSRARKAELRVRGVNALMLFASVAWDAGNVPDVDLAVRAGAGFSSAD